MIVNPYTDRHLMATYAGTRLLQENFGLVGAQIQDTVYTDRIWTITAFYAPITQRSLGGIRAKLIDQTEFTTFCNQRDLEVLIGDAPAGSRCYWARQDYPEINDREWCGFCMDEDDLEDDLHEREMSIRVQSSTGLLLLGNLEIHRRLHLDSDIDVEEFDSLIWDLDPETGISPDVRIETIDRRWKMIDKTRIPWGSFRRL